MPILLFRVDERLIHGQVVIGWGNELRPDRYVVVDDELAASEWEKELYRLAVGDGPQAIFVTVEEARRRMLEWTASEQRSLLLTRNIASMLRVAEGGVLQGRSVNLGGIHHAPGRRRVRSYLYLDEADRERVRALEAEGAHVSGRDLPGSLKVGLEDLLEE